MKYRSFLFIFLTILLPPTILSAQAQQEGEEEAPLPILRAMNGGTHEIPLKAIKIANEPIDIRNNYEVEASDVITIEQSKNLLLSPDQGQIIKVKAIDAQLNEIPLYFADNIIKVDLASGSYILNVNLNANGNEYAFVTILVVLDTGQTISQINIQNIINAFSSKNINTNIIFEDSDDNNSPPAEEELDICYFDPEDEQCAPINGDCREGYAMNENGRCFKSGPCPPGYARVDDDETGVCHANTIRCEGSNAIVLRQEDCAIYDPPTPEPEAEALASNDTSTSTQEPEPPTTESEEVVEEIEARQAEADNNDEPADDSNDSDSDDSEDNDESDEEDEDENENEEDN